MVLQGLTNHKLFKLDGHSAGVFSFGLAGRSLKAVCSNDVRGVAFLRVGSLTYRVARRCNESLAHTAKVGRSLPYNRA
jgi:hypothetical protein